MSVLLVGPFRGVAVLELGVDTRKSKVVTARLRKGHSDKEPTTLTCLLMAGLRSGPGDSLKRLGFLGRMSGGGMPDWPAQLNLSPK